MCQIVLIRLWVK